VPTGIFTETAMALIDKVVPAPRPEDRDLALAAAQDWLIRHGVTTVTDMGTTIEDWQSLRRAGDAGRLQVRVIGYAAGTDAMSLIAGPGPTPWLYDDRLKLNGVALVLDGALSTGMAWTGASSGGARLNPTQLRNLMSRAAIDRFQVAIEAHGEAATGAALDAVAELAQTYQGDRRWRITGVEKVAPTDPARFGKDISATLTGLASTTPPARDLAGANVKLASGSGGPGGLAPLSAISAGDPRQALATWTTGAAWAGMAETKVGRLAPGLRADFILLDRDPFAAGASDPAATRVTEVWIGGRKVFGD
jgi:predicted amidohydrolase YtcJ